MPHHYALPNDPVRSRQDIRRNRQADLLCRFQIDDEFELLRLLDGKISGLGSFEDLVDIGGGAPEQVGNARAVGHKPPGFHMFSLSVYRREPALYREFCNLFSARIKDGAPYQHKYRVSPSLACGSKCGLKILGI